MAATTKMSRMDRFLSFMHEENHGRMTVRDSEAHKIEQNGDTPEPLTPPRRVSISERINHFTWAWFLMTMSTGGIALLLTEQVHTFRGLLTIGKVIFIFDLFLFVVFTILISIRFSRMPSRLRKSLIHPSESLLFPAWFLSVATIISCIHQYGVPSTGPWLDVVLRVLFWIYTACSFLLAVFQYWLLFTGKQLTIRNMMPSWLLPIFPVMLCGTIASAISPQQPPYQRMPILIAGVNFQGLGFWAAILVYGIYIGRLMENGLPAPNLRPGMFIAVGPPSFTALALIGMSRSIPVDHEYFASHPTAPENLQQLALVFAIFIWGLAFWFFCMTLASVILTIPHMTFHLVWYGFVFPNVGFTIATINIAKELGSVAMTWVGTAMSLILIAVWLFVMAAHARALWRGDILWPGKDEDKDS